MSSHFGTLAVLLIVVLDVSAVQAATMSHMQANGASTSPLMRKENLLSEAKKNATTKAIDIDVYYETRCPGCLLFLNKTLEPLWRKKEARELFNINLYTYGNGATVPLQNISDGYKFWHPESTSAGWNAIQICQHGSDECLGNLVQNCAKDISTDEEHKELVFCMTGATIDGYGVEKASYECMEHAGIEKDKVRDCVTSPRGNQLATTAGETTKKLKSRKGTPWVMVGGRHVVDNVLMDSKLLLQAVCSIADNVPGQCAPFQNMTAPAEPAPTSSTPDFKVLEDEGLDELLKVSSV